MKSNITKMHGQQHIKKKHFECVGFPVVYKASSLTTCMTEISSNLINYVKAAPQITLHVLGCKLMMLLP